MNSFCKRMFWQPVKVYIYIKICTHMIIYVSIILISDLSDKIKQDFFQAVAVTVLLYGHTTRTLMKCLENKLNRKDTRILHALLNKSWKDPTKQMLYGHLPPITKIIQIRWARRAGHCWKRRNKLISNSLLSTPTHGHASVGQPGKTYIHQLCADIGCSLEDLSGDRDQERIKEFHAICSQLDDAELHTCMWA